MIKASNYRYQVQSFLIRWHGLPANGDARRAAFDVIREQLVEFLDDVVIALTFLAKPDPDHCNWRVVLKREQIPLDIEDEEEAATLNLTSPTFTEMKVALLSHLKAAVPTLYDLGAMLLSTDRDAIRLIIAASKGRPRKGSGTARGPQSETQRFFLERMRQTGGTHLCRLSTELDALQNDHLDTAPSALLGRRGAKLVRTISALLANDHTAKYRIEFAHPRGAPRDLSLQTHVKKLAIDSALALHNGKRKRAMHSLLPKKQSAKAQLTRSWSSPRNESEFLSLAKSMRIEGHWPSTTLPKRAKPQSKKS